MTERITNGLRTWTSDHFGIGDWRYESIMEFADRIDAALKDCYVELPKDADGEYVHIGDRMESGDWDVFIVSSVDYGRHSWHGRGEFWMLWNEDADFYERAYECRHHKQPTVEDVLLDMHRRLSDVSELYDVDSDELEDKYTSTIAEYAAKLQLRGDAE